MGDTIRCRAKISDSCYDGMPTEPIYGDAGQEADGTWDGDTIVCDACYIKGGQPSLHVSEIRSRQQVIEHVNRELGIE